MPADLESRLAAARPAAPDAPSLLIGALRRRRRVRRIALTCAVLSAPLAVAVSLWTGLPVLTPEPPRTVAPAPGVFVPTIRALSAANPAMDAETLRLPSLTADAAAPTTVRSFNEVGG